MAKRKPLVLILLSMVAGVVLLNWAYYRAQQTPQVVEQQVRMTHGLMDTGQKNLSRFKERFGRYPASLEEAHEKGYGFSLMDFHRNAFLYRVASDGQSYVLTSVGPDGDEGTADDNVRRGP